MGEVEGIACDALDQGSFAILGSLSSATESGPQVIWLFDALSVETERTRNIAIVAAQVACLEELLRKRESISLDCHGRVLEDDAQGRQSRADGSLEVEPRHPECSVTHEMDAELVWCGPLRPER